MPEPPIEFHLTKKAPCMDPVGDCQWASCVGEGPGCPIDGRHKNICRKCDYPRPCESNWSNKEQKYLPNPLLFK